MKIFVCSTLFVLMLSGANSTGVTGQWQGTASFLTPSGKKQTTGIYFNLTQNGVKLTGTANEPLGNKVIPVAIQNGTVQGKAVSFSATINNTAETFHLNLVSPTLMSGKMTGGGVTATLHVRLEKKP